MYVLGLVWLPDFIVWLAGIAIALYIYGTWPFSTLSAHGYKGPKPVPFMGNLGMLLSYGHFGSWDLVGKKLYGKIFALYEGRQPTLVVFDTDVLKQVQVKEFTNFSERRVMTLRGDIMKYSLLDVTGAEWRRIRGMTSPFFTTGKLKKNVQLVGHCCENLIKKCDDLVKVKEDLDAKEVIGAYTLETICLTALGLEVDSQNNPDHILMRTVKRIMQINMKYWAIWVGFLFPPLVPFLEKIGCHVWPKGSMETLKDLATVALDERRKSNEERPDFIQTMLKAHEEELEHGSEGIESGADRGRALTVDEIAAQVALFALAGYDTTSTSISFLLFNLASKPEYQERVVQEIDDVIGQAEISYDNLKEMHYLDMCMEENHRLYPPGFRGERRCLKDITINGYFIPKDTLVIVPIFGIHRDPEYWPDPEKFDPERFSSENRGSIDPYAYQAFGMGPRNCVGMRLAQIEVKMAVIKILQKYKVTVSEKTKVPLKLQSDFFPKAVGGIHLKLENRLAK